MTRWLQRENGYFCSFDTIECVKPCYYDGKHDHLKIVPIIATIFDPGLNSPKGYSGEELWKEMSEMVYMKGASQPYYDNSHNNVLFLRQD